MNILIYFFASYLLAPLFVAVMIFVLTGIKTIKSKLSLKKLIIFILLASIAVALPSLFGFLKNEYVWGGLTFTILSYILLGALFCKLPIPNSGHSHSNHNMRFRRMVLLSAV